MRPMILVIVSGIRNVVSKRIEKGKIKECKAL
jgi:hypothetical protein